jgi:aspartate aminotransferase
VRQLQSQGKTAISLMRGEPDFKTPPHIVEAAVEALRAGRTGYPDNRGEMRLREAVAIKLQRNNGLTYSAASEILVTTGATMGLYCALTALLEIAGRPVRRDQGPWRSPLRPRRRWRT